MTDKKNNLIWIDLEMTGLQLPKDRIIEIATIVTDLELNVIAIGPEFAIHQDEALLTGMDEWNTKHHTESGLVDKVRASTINEEEAQRATLEFLAQYVAPCTSPMCGNSIWQDRRFLERYMPELEQFFHYRHLDVSTLKILAKNWMPGLAENFAKQNRHRAVDDIKDSIAELKFYRQHLLRTQ